MARPGSAERFRFLFRQDRGTIGPGPWRRGAAALLLAWIAAMLAEWAANRGGSLAKVGVTALFVLATMLVAVCYYFLSAKRFADRGRPRSLALVMPAMGLAAAALTFMQPAEGATFPWWLTRLADLALAGVAGWNLVELGFLPGRTDAGADPDG